MATTKQEIQKQIENILTSLGYKVWLDVKIADVNADADILSFVAATDTIHSKVLLLGEVADETISQQGKPLWNIAKEKLPNIKEKFVNLFVNFLDDLYIDIRPIIIVPADICFRQMNTETTETITNIKAKYLSFCRYNGIDVLSLKENFSNEIPASYNNERCDVFYEFIELMITKLAKDDYELNNSDKNKSHSLFKNYATPGIKVPSDLQKAADNLVTKREEKEDSLNESACIAAIAQCMSRNLSHNIGSHVFTNLIGNDIYSNLKNKIKNTLPELNGIKMDCDSQLSFFNQYIKNRMDYLSEVTFGVSNFLVMKSIQKDILLEFYKVRLLQNFISGISDFSFSFKEKYTDSKGNEMEGLPNKFAAIPSGVLGCMAFNNIIENIIRNTAKYAKIDKKRKIIFTIHITEKVPTSKNKPPDDMKQYYAVEIFDDIAIEGRMDKSIKSETDLKDLVTFFCNGQKVEKFFDKTVNKNGEEFTGYTPKKEKISELDWLVAQQNHRIKSSILDEETHTLRAGSLGLLEMEASAAFLRQIDLSCIEKNREDAKYKIENSPDWWNTKRKLNILKAFKAENKYLGYRFFLRKPLEILFVGDWKEIENKNREDLQQYGIDFKSEEELYSDLRKDKPEDGKFVHHQFICYFPENENGTISEQLKKPQTLPLLPLRIITINDEKKAEIEEILKANNFGFERLKKKIWNIFYSRSGITLDDIKIATNKQDVNKYQIVFYSHMGEDNDEKTEFAKAIKEAKENDKIWLEGLSSRACGQLPQFNEIISKISTNSVSTSKKITKYCAKIDDTKINDTATEKFELFEAFWNSVIVLDERIQLEGMRDSGLPELKKRDIWEAKSIFVPDKEECDLEPASFKEDQIKKIKCFCEEPKKGKTSKFVIIHYGILERMYDQNDNGKNQFLKDITDKGSRVIITSGRGKHSLRLPNYVCFMNFSSIFSCFANDYSKYSINNLLNQARQWRK